MATGECVFCDQKEKMVKPDRTTSRQPKSLKQESEKPNNKGAKGASSKRGKETRSSKTKGAESASLARTAEEAAGAADAALEGIAQELEAARQPLTCCATCYLHTEIIDHVVRGAGHAIDEPERRIWAVIMDIRATRTNHEVYKSFISAPNVLFPRYSLKDDDASGIGAMCLRWYNHLHDGERVEGGGGDGPNGGSNKDPDGGDGAEEEGPDIPTLQQNNLDNFVGVQEYATPGLARADHRAFAIDQFRRNNVAGRGAWFRGVFERGLTGVDALLAAGAMYQGTVVVGKTIGYAWYKASNLSGILKSAVCSIFDKTENEVREVLQTTEIDAMMSRDTSNLVVTALAGLARGSGRMAKFIKSLGRSGAFKEWVHECAEDLGEAGEEGKRLLDDIRNLEWKPIITRLVAKPGPVKYAWWCYAIAACLTGVAVYHGCKYLTGGLTDAEKQSLETVEQQSAELDFTRAVQRLLPGASREIPGELWRIWAKPTDKSQIEGRCRRTIEVLTKKRAGRQPYTEEQAGEAAGAIYHIALRMRPAFVGYNATN